MGFTVLILVLLPIVAGALLPLFVKEKDRDFLIKYVTVTVCINAGLVVLLLTSSGIVNLRMFEITRDINFYLNLDPLAMFFIVFVTSLWLLVTVYSFGYMEVGNKDRRFYAFFLMTYGVVLGACVAGNFFTFYLFYEFMTLCAYPLVIHKENDEAMQAGTKYLMYSFFGASLCLLTFMFMGSYGIGTDFISGGVLNLDLLSGNENMLLVVYLLGFLGFGCKAGIFPLHSWLPVAHPVAPAPASALLSGVITKVGVVAIIRLTFYFFGVDFVSGSWVQTVLIFVVLFTVFMGSMLAYKEKGLKKRLAYSSISQLSYVLFGVIFLSPITFLGALLHVVFHGMIKVTLFLCAGTIIHETGKKYVTQLRGIGKEMPVTMWTFTIASIALVGIPPTGGFISKWYLAIGTIESSMSGIGLFGIGVLLISALLTAGYLISITARGFFPGYGYDYTKLVYKEPKISMTAPLVVMAGLCVVFGMFSGFITGFIDRITTLIF